MGVAYVECVHVCERSGRLRVFKLGNATSYFSASGQVEGDMYYIGPTESGRVQ